MQLLRIDLMQRRSAPELRSIRRRPSAAHRLQENVRVRIAPEAARVPSQLTGPLTVQVLTAREAIGQKLRVTRVLPPVGIPLVETARKERVLGIPARIGQPVREPVTTRRELEAVPTMTDQ